VSHADEFACRLCPTFSYNVQIFIVCNFQPDKNSPDVAVNDEHAMMRFEFLEAIVRLGAHNVQQSGLRSSM
jgi:hypothetical protein